MRIPSLLSILAALIVSGCASQPEAAPGPVARASAVEADGRREAAGFRASVIVTADARWKQKYCAPLPGVPRVPRTDSVRIGGKVWALLFLSNPLPDAVGNVDVTCDVRMVRPNGRVSVHRDVKALHKNLGAMAQLTFLSEFVLTMNAEATDPLGEWVVELTVRDRNRGVEVPVVGRFTLLPAEDARGAAARVQ